jgi:hypothetical protein
MVRHGTSLTSLHCNAIEKEEGQKGMGIQVVLIRSHGGDGCSIRNNSSRFGRSRSRSRTLGRYHNLGHSHDRTPENNHMQMRSTLNRRALLKCQRSGFRTRRVPSSLGKIKRYMIAFWGETIDRLHSLVGIFHLSV